MKNNLIKYFLILFVFIFSTAFIGSKRDINIDTFKSKGVVTIIVTGANVDLMSEIIILRGTDASESLRQIKVLSNKEIEQLKNAPLTLIDKYPLSGTDNVLYRAAVTYKEGYQKFFPASQMKIDSSYTN